MDSNKRVSFAQPAVCVKYIHIPRMSIKVPCGHFALKKPIQ